ncbi:MAG: TGS domain-containing protein [Dehalococcoidia bacterium]|nr:TGS domain-containing protein [Dehalococcoidia bacterium]
MPANLPPQYFEAEKRYRSAKEPEEKIAALQAMLAIMPRHKGTDKLHAGLRRKIARFSQEAERKYATARRAGFHISREGAGQIMLVGPAKVGKSQLLAAVTEAVPEIAEYPFTTQTPIPGMMKFEDIQIQLVDTPPIGHKEVRVLLANALRNADIIAIVIDLSLEPITQVEAALQGLREARIEPLTDDGTQLTPGSYPRKMLIVGNKNELAGSNENWERLHSQYAELFPLVSISAREGGSLEEFKRAIYQALNIIRVYTKTPGSKADLTDPMILEKGSTLEEAAESLHKDFRQNLKYAVVWGSGKYDGQRVSKEHVLQDGDVVEFHI